MTKTRTKKAEELDYGDRVVGYSTPLREVVLNKDSVEGITELGDVVKFDRGATVELATPWPQGNQIVYLYDWQTGAIGSDYNINTGYYSAYTTLYGYRFDRSDNLGEYGAAAIVPMRELSELDEAYKSDNNGNIIAAVENFLSAMGRLN